MSNDVQLVEKIDKAALNELAKVILSELTMYESKRLKQRGVDYGDKLRKARAMRYDAENGYADVREKIYEGLDTATSEYVESAVEFAPRQSRSEFRAQRIERRNNRSFQEGDGAGFIAEALSADAQRQNTTSELAQGRQAEKLSELFCRDSRRYDGAFERY